MPNRALLVTGAAIIAASYTPAVIVAATSDHPGDKWLYAPVAGPWVDLAERGGCGSSCTGEAINKGLLVLTGVAHLVGVGAVIGSFIVPERQTTTSTAATSTKPTIVPARLGTNGYGLSLVGRF